MWLGTDVARRVGQGQVNHSAMHTASPGAGAVPQLRPRLLSLITATAALLLGACAGLPPAPQLPPTHAVAASSDSPLGRIALASWPDPELSGFRLMPSGDFALDTRLQLIRRAELSLDVQYYQIQNDATGRYFLRALRDAARRGVRVRLLLDDLHTSGDDALLLALAATPNLELRLFNPFPAGRDGLAARFTASLFDFDRVNRRMHNKLFIADGAMAIAGGRNIGSPYFRQTLDENFLDIDTFVIGALVPRLGELFDRYWNSAHVYPIAAVVGAAARRDDPEAWFEAATAAAHAPPPQPPPPNDLLGYGPLRDELDAGKLGLVWATAEAFADDPDRVIGKQVSYGGVPLLDVDAVRYNVREQMRRSRTEVTMVSPYLIPGPEGLEVLREITGRGVRIVIVTNSLSSTDEPLAYGGYRPYRPELLRLGAQIWELSSMRARGSIRLGLFGSKVGRLHAKAVIFDGDTLYIGSMNLDPRSNLHNTEIGLIVRSPELAAQVSNLIDGLRQQGAWRVRLAPDGEALEWVSSEGDDETVLTDEPDVQGWDLLRLHLLMPLIPESLL
jgi:cardiolipin synthase C